MTQIIEMAKLYRKRPSELMGIEDSYIAYCFDEVCYHYQCEATDDKGKINWNKIKWTDEKKKSNKDLINFINKHK